MHEHVLSHYAYYIDLELENTTRRLRGRENAVARRILLPVL